jgi:hypothetical protein
MVGMVFVDVVDLEVLPRGAAYAARPIGVEQEASRDLFRDFRRHLAHRSPQCV